MGPGGELRVREIFSVRKFFTAGGGCENGRAMKMKLSFFAGGLFLQLLRDEAKNDPRIDEAEVCKGAWDLRRISLVARGSPFLLMRQTFSLIANPLSLIDTALFRSEQQASPAEEETAQRRQGGLFRL